MDTSQKLNHVYSLCGVFPLYVSCKVGRRSELFSDDVFTESTRSFMLSASHSVIFVPKSYNFRLCCSHFKLTCWHSLRSYPT